MSQTQSNQYRTYNESTYPISVEKRSHQKDYNTTMCQSKLAVRYIRPLCQLYIHTATTHTKLIQQLHLKLKLREAAICLQYIYRKIQIKVITKLYSNQKANWIQLHEASLLYLSSNSYMPPVYHRKNHTKIMTRVHSNQKVNSIQLHESLNWSSNSYKPSVYLSGKSHKNNNKTTG